MKNLEDLKTNELIKDFKSKCFDELICDWLVPAILDAFIRVGNTKAFVSNKTAQDIFILFDTIARMRPSPNVLTAMSDMLYLIEKKEKLQLDLPQ